LISKGEGRPDHPDRLDLAATTRPMSGPHAASKAGEIQPLARDARWRWASTHHLQRGGARPDHIAGISLSSQNPEYQKAFVTQVPLGRLPCPTRSPTPCVHRVDRARFISGQLLCVDVATRPANWR